MTSRSCSSFSSKLSTSMILIIVNICMIINHVAIAQQQQSNNSSKTLRIAVPVKEGFKEFVNISNDPITGKEIIDGFSIDLFEAVVNVLPESQRFDYKLVPFEKPDGTMNGSYDDMLRAVYSEDYDAAVGDISIRYERMDKWVDFTMPYADSGVSMLVPLHRTNNSDSSLSKFDKALIGVVVGVCFLCLVAALLPCFIDSGEKEPKQTRLVIVVCFLIGVVLSTCFGLLVISLLTKERPKPIVSKIHRDQLRKENRNVGYQTGSFVKNELIEDGFATSQLKPFSTVDELAMMLAKGTQQGGVDAAIEETSQLKVFLKHHCKGYTLVSSAELHGDGLAFAFPKRSELVHDLSLGILDVTNDYDKYKKIMGSTIGNLDKCLSDDTSYNYDFLKLNWKPTKWILVAGGISVVFLVTILILGCVSCDHSKNRLFKKIAVFWQRFSR